MSFGVILRYRKVPEHPTGFALDAGLLAAANAVEHDEISRYGTSRAWARLLGFDKLVPLLDETL